MLCRCCGKKPASTYIKIVHNGKITSLELCADCASQLGCGNLFTGLGYRISDIVHEFFADTENDEVRCSCCGSTFSSIVRSGRVGCEECYKIFANRLLPMIRQIHGSDLHRGKTPGGMLSSTTGAGELAVRGSGPQIGDEDQ
ncbi:MAG: UVR domain-containing protein [Thermocaproicibacter melissae]|jgi:protein arginine kinase activator|uniref:hypothetical protein n=1 Tax=Thermocaproicibacter melissae TaxID=2966552 RepID=UPI0024B04336|nr:hypothetical protein [Thermocaproicibacter melissae]WBY64908.1 hypothetical protein NOG13_04250 [Thermocaproicibacter melissae]